ncbi:MAG: hypothetical protein QOH83_77, partial [Solirubrobacteraceae bacterium]|nr:hypothetical protein [Solirubrobacteraceae bacterium]
MNHLHHHLVRNGLLAGTVVIAMGLVTGATA